MTIFVILGALGATITAFLFRRGGIYNPPLNAPVPEEKAETTESTTPPVTPVLEAHSEPETMLWDTPRNAWHSVRVICDNDGLLVSEKNLICAVIYQESRFKNTAICRNKDKQGNVLSSDWGICQVNDYWHCGKGKTFPSSEYVVANPEKAVRWMISMYHMGLLKLWVAYSSKAYLVWLKKDSPMWNLAK